jgi:hypothetical protein
VTKNRGVKSNKHNAKAARSAGFNHKCDWREAAIKLARCVVATLQADGKIGVGSGMVMKERDGKTIIERWDKDFHEALAFIGVKMVDKPEKKPKKSRRAAEGLTA